MILPEAVVKGDKSLTEWAELVAYRGSVAHGMYVPSSDPLSIDDVDAMVLCVPDQDYYHGLKEFGSRGTKEIKDGEWDIVIYEARKLLRLLEGGNPNVLSLLWLKSGYYIKKTLAGQYLLDNRVVFTGKHVYTSFTGYAMSQLNKMEKFTFDGYMGTKRKALVERFGYDVKNAAHLIRLLRMSIEFLETGALYVDRTGIDAEELLSIKRGEWKLEDIKREASFLFAKAEEARTKSRLPDRPNREEINKLCRTIVEMAWEERGT